MAITAQHLRQLFESDLPDPQLVVAAGDAEVVAGPAGDEDGLVVVSRAELVAQVGSGQPTPDALRRLAERLDSAVTGMGG
jgi:hypothetical protein